ncbi:hypothetical protein [Microcoleus vaginatus]|uniref:hypothetical protein n=1 Tax=Microcoleus vaginatus TaxID=119532 RepID=UPI00020D169F|nr:hypothetical protein MicvaDRAFT_3816 [Microcoleus vaginatus FGP-2]
MNAAKPSEKPDMELMNGQQAKREADRAQAHRDELTERIAPAIRQDGTIEPLKGLHFYRSSSWQPNTCPIYLFPSRHRCAFAVYFNHTYLTKVGKSPP